MDRTSTFQKQFDRLCFDGRTVIVPDYDNFADVKEAGRQLRDLARTGFRPTEVLQEVFVGSRKFGKRR
jgi:hypothetical protein